MEGLEWRFSSARLRMANDTVTPSDLVAFLFSDNPKLERMGEAHLSYYTSADHRMETNQTPQDLSISSM